MVIPPAWCSSSKTGIMRSSGSWVGNPGGGSGCLLDTRARPKGALLPWVQVLWGLEKQSGQALPF